MQDLLNLIYFCISICLSYWEQLQDAAFLLLKESRELEKNPMASKGSHLQHVRPIEQAHRLFAETKEHVFESKASEEHAKLLRYFRMWCSTKFVIEDTNASFLAFKWWRIYNNLVFSKVNGLNKNHVMQLKTVMVLPVLKLMWYFADQSSEHETSIFSSLQVILSLFSSQTLVMQLHA